MTHPTSFHGSLIKYWEILYAEYKRLTAVHGRAPFEFIPPNSQAINEYIPKNGDEIIIYFWDKEHKHELLVIEASLLPDEDQEEVLIMVFPQGNAFEEPIKSAMSTWKEIKKALEKSGNQGKQSSQSITTNIYVGGNVTGGNIISGNENKADVNSAKTKKKRK